MLQTLTTQDSFCKQLLCAHHKACVNLVLNAIQPAAVLQELMCHVMRPMTKGCDNALEFVTVQSLHCCCWELVRVSTELFFFFFFSITNSLQTERHVFKIHDILYVRKTFFPVQTMPVLFVLLSTSFIPKFYFDQSLCVHYLKQQGYAL